MKLTNKLISEIGVKEKYIRKCHYNTIKTWWARRPITTMRSLLVREILYRNSTLDKTINEQIITGINPSTKILDSFSKEHQTENLHVLDVFSGGGSIPFESARLGFKTTSSELNPVASLLQETIFNSMPINNYSDKLRQAGYNVIDRAERRIGKYFSFDGTKPYVFFWSKVAKCKKCNEDLDLRRIEYFSKRKTRPCRILDIDGQLKLLFDFGSEKRLKKEFICKNCKTEHSFKDIKNFCKTNKFKHSPFAVCYNSGLKKYKIITNKEKTLLKRCFSDLSKEIQNLSSLIPTGSIKIKSGVINPTLYDLKEPKDFYNKRQLLTLLTIIDEIANEYSDLVKSYGGIEGKQIVLGLSSLIDFLVDWNSVSTMWISQNEQTGRCLAGPGVGMKWDFIEINPFLEKGSNLRSKINRVCDTFEAIKFNNPINILNGSSTNLPLNDKSVDIVLTDPPYYDSIDYTGLSEFFRPWLEVLLKKTFANNDINLKNQDNLEAIVELAKNSSKDHDHYELIMTGVLTEVNRVLKNNGSVLFLFSHKTFEGWKVIADSFVNSKLFVTECIPIEMERIARPRAMAYEALNGVIVFRLSKNIEGITSLEKDVSNIRKMLLVGDILDSQIIIYLAALAVKYVTLTNISYKDAYKETVRSYEKVRLEKWINSNMDMITKSYLEAVLKEGVSNLECKYLDVLNHHNLLINSHLKTMNDININDEMKETILDKAIHIYQMFKFNSKTKIYFEKKDEENLKSFFSIISGFQLNTVSKRSSTDEVKVARLILSKIG